MKFKDCPTPTSSGPYRRGGVWHHRLEWEQWPGIQATGTGKDATEALIDSHERYKARHWLYVQQRACA